METILIYSSEDHGYIANIPELKYCSVFGETAEIALAEIAIAQEIWLQTQSQIIDPLL